MELGWAGRSGGLDARPTSKGGSVGGGGGVRKGGGEGGLPLVGASSRQQWQADGSDGEDIDVGDNDALHRSRSAPDFPAAGVISASGNNQRQSRTRRQNGGGLTGQSGVARASPLAGGGSRVQ